MRAMSATSAASTRRASCWVRPVWGMLADRLGRARVLLVGPDRLRGQPAPAAAPPSPWAWSASGAARRDGLFCGRGRAGGAGARRAVHPRIDSRQALCMARCDVAARVPLFGPGLNAAAERLVGLGSWSVLVQGSSTTLVIASLGRARRADDAGPGRNASRTFLP
ncbi:hypothetical protein ACPA9J_03475 [Pseudomonas aeruginosa]